MNASKLLVFLLLLVAAGTGVALLLTTGEDREDDAPPISTVATLDQDERPVQGEQRTAEPVQAVPTSQVPERVAVVENSANEDYPQGARGQIVDPSGLPLPDTKVYLVEGTGGNLFRHMQLTQKGAIVPPVARSQTDRSGRFALGLERADPKKSYEVRVVSDQYVDHKIPNVTIRNGEWYEAGVIKLKQGAVLYGRVSIKASSGMPVPNATISVEAMNPFPSLTPTPGREDGLVAQADQTGAYRIENVPPGMVSVSAVAPGYARVHKPNIKINKATPNQLEFELPPGVSIAGTVTDTGGNPVASAKIEALSLSSKAGIQNTTRSGEDGRFEVIGLMTGQYMLTALAPGYVRTELKPIQSGQSDVEIFMEKQGSARIKVFDKNGRVLTKRYRIAVKKYFEAQQQFGNSVVQPRWAKPDRNGIYEVEGLNPDSYVFQVEAEGHAKAFSDPFQIAIGGEPPLVQIELNLGGSIRGVVQDQRGQPLAGVTVKTLPNDFDDNAFTKMFAGMIPYKITRTSTKTDSRGQFELDTLNPGTYQLKFVHPEHFDVQIKDSEVVVGQTTTIQPMKMQPGTVVSGVVRVDGSPNAQVKVTITAVADQSAPNPSLFSAEAISNNEGQFQMAKRVPPGRYQVMAARQTLQNPLMQIADFHKTKQEFTLGPGQLKYYLEINIPSQ